MRAFLSFVLISAALSIGGCSGGSSPGVTPSSAVPASVTPIPGASYVYRLDTFEKVYQAFVVGRVPAGLANEVTITVAAARIDRLFAGDDLPQSGTLHLAMVGTWRADFLGADGPDYEWWFVTRDGGGSGYPLAIKADAPELRIGLRNVGGTWGLYADTGDGWQSIEGTFAFGELEASAEVPIASSWPLHRGRLTYIRAVVRHRQPTPEGYQVGGVYPEDLSWQFAGE
jgi:hypothetical protein